MSKVVGAVAAAAPDSEDDDIGSDGDIDSGEERERREIERRFRPASASQSSAVREYVGPKGAKDVEDYATYLKRRAKEELEWAQNGKGAVEQQKKSTAVKSVANSTAVKSASNPPPPAVNHTPSATASAQSASATSLPPAAAAAPAKSEQLVSAVTATVVAPKPQESKVSVPAAAFASEAIYAPPPKPPKSDFEKFMDLIEADILAQDATPSSVTPAAQPKPADAARAPVAQHADPYKVRSAKAMPDPAAVADLHRKISEEIKSRKAADALFYDAVQALDDLLSDVDFRAALHKFVDNTAAPHFRVDRSATRGHGEHTHQEFAAFKSFSKAVEKRITDVISAAAPSADVDAVFERLVEESDADESQQLLSLESWEVLLAALKFEAFCDFVEARMDSVARSTATKQSKAPLAAAADPPPSTPVGSVTPPRPPLQPKPTVTAAAKPDVITRPGVSKSAALPAASRR